MNRGLKTQLKVSIVAISTSKTKYSRYIHAMYCLQDFFQSTTKVGMVAVFTKFPQKVGDFYVVKQLFIVYKRCCEISLEQF